MAMTVDEAVEQLQLTGLFARKRSQKLIMGAVSMIPIYDVKDEFMGTLPSDEFNIEHHSHEKVWAASITVGQTCPFIKVDAELSSVVRAVQDFYALCNHINLESEDVRSLMTIVQRLLGLVIDICDIQSLRVRLPLTHDFPNTFKQMLASPHLTYREDVFYIRFQESRWQLEYWCGSEMQFTMPLLHLEEVNSVLVRFYGHPRGREAPPAQ